MWRRRAGSVARRDQGADAVAVDDLLFAAGDGEGAQGQLAEGDHGLGLEQDLVEGLLRRAPGGVDRDDAADLAEQGALDLLGEALLDAGDVGLADHLVLVRGFAHTLADRIVVGGEVEQDHVRQAALEDLRLVDALLDVPVAAVVGAVGVVAVLVSNLCKRLSRSVSRG